MDVALVRTEPCQRSHHDAMSNVDGTDLEGLKKSRDG
jgi:hypothetical protein